jgi:hypothetical protein
MSCLAMRARDAMKAGSLCDSRRTPRRRLDARALQRLQRSRVTRTVPEHAANLGKPDALRSDRHHHAREARLRLAQFERVDAVALSAKLVSELAQPVRLADLDRIAAEPRPERGVDYEPLDQRSQLFDLRFSG